MSFVLPERRILPEYLSGCQLLKKTLLVSCNYSNMTYWHTLKNWNTTNILKMSILKSIESDALVIKIWKSQFHVRLQSKCLSFCDTKWRTGKWWRERTRVSRVGGDCCPQTIDRILASMVGWGARSFSRRQTHKRRIASPQKQQTLRNI
jgi:hypothetical protein